MKRFIAAFLLLVCSGMAFGQDAFQQSEAIDQAAAAQEAQKAQAINDQIPDYQVVGGQVNQNTFGELKSDYRARLLAAHEVYGTPKPACMGVILDDCNYDGPVLNDIANDPELIQKILDRDKVNNAKWAAEKVTRDAQEAAEQKVQAAKDAQAAAEQAAYSAAHPPLSGGGILFWLIFWFVAYWLPSIMATARAQADCGPQLHSWLDHHWLDSPPGVGLQSEPRASGCTSPATGRVHHRHGGISGAGLLHDGLWAVGHDARRPWSKVGGDLDLIPRSDKRVDQAR
jgi:hypothetical protein